MKTFIGIVVVVISLNVGGVALLFGAQAYHSLRRKRHRRGDIETVLAKMEEEGLFVNADEPSNVVDFSASSEYLLELASDGQAFVLRVGDNGIVTANTLLGPAENRSDAVALAGICGWATADDWENNFASLTPKSVRVAFVSSSEIASDDAVRMARNAGVDVIEYISQEVVADEGKTYVSFSISTPRGWVDSEVQIYA